MTPPLRHIMHALGGSIWAMDPDKLRAAAAFLSTRLAGQKLDAEEIAARLQAARPGRVETIQPTPSEAVAVISVGGVLAHRAYMVEDVSTSRGTSAERVGQQIDAAMHAANVGAVVLDISSPGGNVFGIQELAAKIAGFRGSGKPIVAVANAMATSAAYWLGAAAEEFIVTPSGLVGSIGVYGMHIDESELDAKMGIKVTYISAGKYKVEGNPNEPLDDEARAAMQAQVDEYYDAFVTAVAKYRGTSPKAVRAGFGQGRTVTARQALSEGMVDRIQTLDDVLARLTKRATRSGGTRALAPALTLTGLPAGSAVPLSASDAPAASAIGDSFMALAGSASEDAPPVSLVLIEPAPAAKESAMHDNVTTVEKTAGGAAAAGDQHAAPAAVGSPQAVATALAQLAKEHGFADRTAELLATAATIEAGSRVVLDWVRERAAAAPAVRTGTPVVTGGRPRGVDRPWQSLGEQLLAVREAYSPGSNVDDRLWAGATGGNQGVPSEGGFLVAPQFASEIMDPLQQSPNSLLAQTDRYTVEGDSLTFNANAETSRATGSRFGGVRGYWIAEADQIDKSKPKFRQLKLEPQQLAVLLYATDKVLRNATALGQWYNRAAREEIDFLVGDAIVNGDGVGKPLGLLKSGSLITVAKETNQAADTILEKNISKMWARLHPRSRPNAIWLHNVDVEPELDALSTTVKNVAGTENVGGFASKVFDSERRTLKGRPLVACEFADTLGNLGDLILVDLGCFATGLSGRGIEEEMSIHVRFEFAETAFRTMFAVDGQPWLGAALTPFKGSNTLSTHVALAAR